MPTQRAVSGTFWDDNQPMTTLCSKLPKERPLPFLTELVEEKKDRDLLSGTCHMPSPPEGDLTVPTVWVRSLELCELPRVCDPTSVNVETCAWP